MKGLNMKELKNYGMKGNFKERKQNHFPIYISKKFQWLYNALDAAQEDMALTNRNSVIIKVLADALKKYKKE